MFGKLRNVIIRVFFSGLQQSNLGMIGRRHSSIGNCDNVVVTCVIKIFFFRNRARGSPFDRRADKNDNRSLDGARFVIRESPPPYRR